MSFPEEGKEMGTRFGLERVGRVWEADVGNRKMYRVGVRMHKVRRSED